jgi:hypothetical protein
MHDDDRLDEAAAAAARDARDRRVSSARMQLGMGACLALLGALSVFAARTVPEGASLVGPTLLAAVGVVVAAHAVWRLQRLR